MNRPHSAAEAIKFQFCPKTVKKILLPVFRLGISRAVYVCVATLIWTTEEKYKAIFTYIFFIHNPFARCLKITEKVSFNIASEASYVYILSGQKLIKTVKNGPFRRVFENLKLAVKQCYQTGQFQ